MLKTKVKASSVTNLTDARYFAAWEAEWLGFNFDAGSEEHLSPQNMIAIKEWVDGVKVVGEFGAVHLADDIKAAVDLVGLDAVQLSMLTERETVTELSEYKVIKEFIVQDDSTEADIAEHLADFAAYTENFLLDFSKSKFTWEVLQDNKQITVPFLKELCGDFQIIIDLDFTGDMIEEFLDTVFPHGISIKGGAEEKVGFKSFEEIDDVFEKIEIFR